jgi:hypothetical protein
MIPDSTVRREKGITKWESGIGKVIFAFRNSKITLPCILIDQGV